MSVFVERINSTNIFSLLKETIITTNEILNLRVASVDATFHLERVITVFNQIELILNGVDPDMIPIQPIEVAIDKIHNIQANLNNYKSDGNINHLINCNAFVDGLLLQIATINIPRNSESIEGLRETMTTFKRSIGQHSRNLEDEFSRLSLKKSSLEEEIIKINNTIEQERQRITSLTSQFQNQINDFQQQFSNAQEHQRSYFNNEIDERRNKYSEIIEQFENDHDNLMSNTQKEYALVIQQIKSEQLDFIDSIEESNKQFQQKFEKQAEAIISQMESHKDHVGKLMGIITNSSLASGYQKVANSERTQKFIWQGLTILGFSGLILFAIIASKLTLQVDFNWTTFGGRAFVALAFGTFATYAANQANLHGKIERQNRKMELEFASIDPFLNGFSKEKVEEIKKALVEKMFGNEAPQLSEKQNSEIPKGTLDIVKLVVDSAQQIVKRN